MKSQHFTSCDCCWIIGCTNVYHYRFETTKFWL